MYAALPPSGSLQQPTLYYIPNAASGAGVSGVGSSDPSSMGGGGPSAAHSQQSIMLMSPAATAGGSGVSGVMPSAYQVTLSYQNSQ